MITKPHLITLLIFLFSLYHISLLAQDQQGKIEKVNKSVTPYYFPFLHLRFKTQKTEIDDNNYPATNKSRGSSVIIESLDGGDLGPQRHLYYRELIARYEYGLALNWTLEKWKGHLQ